MLAVRHLVKTFSAGETEVRAVDDVTFDVADGQFAAVVGRSGSGKSTLLSLLGGLDKPTAGHITVADRTITNESDRDLIHYRRDTVGFVFQNYNLIPNLSAVENVMLPLEYARMRTVGQRARAEALLDQVGVSGPKQRRRPGRLSGGEQQRVAIARALANRPKLILADEPTGNLDSETGSLIFELLHDLARSEQTTIVAVTHDLSIAGRTDLTFELRDGRLAGPELATEPTDTGNAWTEPAPQTSWERPGICDVCGFDSSVTIDAAIAGVMSLPERFHVLFDSPDAAPGSAADLSPMECLGYSIDIVRLGTDQLWTLRLDPEARIPAWDRPLRVDRARYGRLSRQVAEPALSAAITTWREAAESTTRTAQSPHPTLSALTPADIIRRTAHESRHHLRSVTNSGISSAAGTDP